jgi:tripeptidyl-peptidase-1
LFFKNFSTPQIGQRPILESIDNGVVQQDDMGFQYNGESNLDLEYAMALVYPQKGTIWSAMVGGNSANCSISQSHSTR